MLSVKCFVAIRRKSNDGNKEIISYMDGVSMCREVVLSAVQKIDQELPTFAKEYPFVRVAPIKIQEIEAFDKASYYENVEEGFCPICGTELEYSENTKPEILGPRKVGISSYCNKCNMNFWEIFSLTGMLETKLKS